MKYLNGTKSVARLELVGVLAVIAVLVASVVVFSPTSAGAGARGPRHSNPFPASASAGLEQFTVTGLEPGVGVNLVVQRGRGNGHRLVDNATADALGSVLFRDVTPGKNYRAQIGRSHSKWERVRSVDAPHPDQSFYDGLTIGSGYQYVETRDGTTLSINVSLPGPPEEGPYPTVVEYSGYDPSNPNGSAFGGIPGMAQPSSMLATVFGYAAVGVNVRGTGCSGGAYDFFETMQLLDGYDVIEAVAAQPWVLNHEVGMVGLSYAGITQLFVGSTNPPSLAAIAPLSVYGDTGSGIAVPGGIPNQGFALSWADNVLNNARPYPSGAGWVRDLIDDGDDVCAGNQALRLQNVDAAQKALDNPFYTEEVAAPLDTRRFVGDIKAAVFMTSAWQDEQTGP
ncbi:MAG: CocE/NonD family hydrolase, partial [Acidobacteria bacterium]|nr:CocE/NonD family hydrolase [Acidobacteriota bacterium]